LSVATVINKVKGTLKLGATQQMEAQVSAIGVPQTVTRDSPVTVLTGDLVQAAAIYSWALTGSVVLDYSDPNGVYYFVQTNQGAQMPFTFLPSGATGPTYTGTVIVDGWSTEELNSGAIAISKFNWPIQGKVVVAAPPAVTATGATAGSPGSYTPAGATAPANLAGLTGVTASPATAWTVGQYVVTADLLGAHWSGTAWVAGKA
jgi:hypothetical protein